MATTANPNDHFKDKEETFYCDNIELNYLFDPTEHDVYLINEDRLSYKTQRLIFGQAIFWHKGKVVGWCLIASSKNFAPPYPLEYLMQGRLEGAFIDYENKIFRTTKFPHSKIKFGSITFTKSFDGVDPEAIERERYGSDTETRRWKLK